VAEIWVVKYKDGKLVGNRGSEASSVKDAKRFISQADAAATAAVLNKGLHENHLGYAIVERVP
jgi:hypothetical protein